MFFTDKVFDENDDHEAIYNTLVQEIVEGCVKGFNGSVMAYGQTASGKTHTMIGTPENPGLIRMAANHIFRLIENIYNDRNYIIRCSYVELYNEKVNDLLVPSSTDLKIYEKEDIVSIDKAKEQVVKTAERMIELIEIGNMNKQMGETAANEKSSRSHSIFRIVSILDFF